MSTLEQVLAHASSPETVAAIGAGVGFLYVGTVGGFYEDLPMMEKWLLRQYPGNEYRERFVPLLRRRVREMYPALGGNGAQTVILIEGGEYGPSWDVNDYQEVRKKMHTGKRVGSHASQLKTTAVQKAEPQARGFSKVAALPKKGSSWNGRNTWAGVMREFVRSGIEVAELTGWEETYQNNAVKARANLGSTARKVPGMRLVLRGGKLYLVREDKKA